jgi:hypothetical protein
MSVEKKSLWEIAATIANTPNEPQWSVVLAPAGLSRVHADALAEQLTSLLDSEKVCRYSVKTPKEIRDAAKTKNAVLVFDGVGRFQEADWRRLDNSRSLLIRACAVIVMEEAQVLYLVNEAPNLCSWIGSSVWSSIDDLVLTEAQRVARLQELRTQFQLTDEQVLTQAQERTLPSDPGFAEWLVLLGRGELIGSSPH